MRFLFVQLALIGSLLWPLSSPADPAQEIHDQRPFSQVIHQFDLRIRNDIFHNGGLNKALSAVPGDHGLKSYTIGDDPLVTGGNIRLRYSPIFRIGENLKLEGRFDLVRTSIYHSIGADEPFEDQVKVRALAAHWEPLPRLWVTAGRIPQHFGLGLVEHDDLCLDCDFDSVLDGVNLQLNLGALSASIGWYWPGEGPNSSWVPKSNVSQMKSGQPYDVAQNDDVGLWHFGLFSMVTFRQMTYYCCNPSLY